MGIHENLIQSFTNFKNKFIGNIGNSTVAALLDAKQNSTDNSLTTSHKTVAGAINELNNDLTDLVSDAVSGTNAVKHPLFHNTSLTALQAWDGNIGHRLQLKSDGGFDIFKTTDGGETWTFVRSL